MATNRELEKRVDLLEAHLSKLTAVVYSHHCHLARLLYIRDSSPFSYVPTTVESGSPYYATITTAPVHPKLGLAPGTLGRLDQVAPSNLIIPSVQKMFETIMYASSVL